MKETIIDFEKHIKELKSMKIGTSKTINGYRYKRINECIFDVESEHGNNTCISIE